MSRSLENYNFRCPNETEALLIYCSRLRSQVWELTEECEQLKAEIKRLRGDDGKLYSIDQARHIKILKGDLW